MKGSAGINSFRSLRISDVKAAKLAGFLRVVERKPSAVMPVFRGLDNSQGPFLYQYSNDQGRISYFVEDFELVDARLLTVNRQLDVDVSLGDYLIYAYETIGGQIVVGNKARIVPQLQQVLDEDDFAKNPFAALELARFVGDVARETSFVLKCFSVLKAKSDSLARSWIGNATLSPKASSVARILSSEKSIRSDSEVSVRNTPSTGQPTSSDLADGSNDQLTREELTRLIQELRIRRQWEAVLDLYREVIKRFPFDVQIWMEYAATLRKRGEKEEAYNLYKQALASFSDNLFAWREAAIGFRKMEFFDDALETHKAIISKFPDEITAWRDYAATLKVMGKVEDAISIYSDTLHKFPHDHLTRLRLIAAHFEAVRDAEAFDLLGYYSNSRAKLPASQKSRGFLLPVMRKLKPLRRAIVVHERVLGAFPGLFAAKRQLADLYLEAQDNLKSIDLYRSLVADHPERESHWKGLIHALNVSGLEDEADLFTRKFKEYIDHRDFAKML
ncbi:MAG: tetratricopeptide repeat protein [Xanthobacteraceae bacterium]|nr:tetratricopeptide repeat protein [Xanthobacteraceae bacterium]